MSMPVEKKKKLTSTCGCDGRKIENSIQIDSSSMPALDTLFNSSGSKCFLVPEG